MAWAEADLVGPDGQDWRVPVSELESRQNMMALLLDDAEIPGVLIQNPVDLYYFAGGRQNGYLWIPSASSAGAPVQFVRRSIRRAKWDAGGDDAPHEVVASPRMANLAEELLSRGCKKDNGAPWLQYSSAPASLINYFSSSLSPLGASGDCSSIVHGMRQKKSLWEIEQMRQGADIQLTMFEAVAEVGREGVTELELVAAAEAVSRAAGFAGNVQLRRYPMQCDRGVIVAGRAGGIPSFFDSAVGGTGPHPMASMGAGFNRVNVGEPVLVDLLHVHRGYTVDMTRMFSVGQLSDVWVERLEDMLTVKEVVVDILDQGKTCAEAWHEGYSLAVELGYENNLMGMKPDQSRFLGHSLGLELDESPVVAPGFDQPLSVGGTMAIEPKVVYGEGSIGSEDTWVMSEEGMETISADGAFPWLHEW
ncbi:MAG TPA: aminopeptidase P family protein [Candidatus Poseidoniales archaeon]|jgi:Xaa-Pro aminopeptidase|nr:aminopeptidase P family protein [Candidatus Poseidoniales archaeon]HIK77859.1 aminopeptidase P family protein [Candidatus Poseidoniales archaeon]